MKLKAIESAYFGVLDRTAPLAFSPGLNVIIGDNQAGKSSMLTLLEWALYGVPPKRSVRNRELVDDWRPWSGAVSEAELTLYPEHDGWPDELRLRVCFDDFKLAVSDAATLGDITSSIACGSNGDWDLGEQLTGLKRATLQGSLLAHQGELENILRGSSEGNELRRLLTADLAGLVEDPQRATLDWAIKQLEKPTFTFGRLSVGSVQMPKLLREADEALRQAHDRRQELEAAYEEFHGRLRDREQEEFRLAELQRGLRRVEDDLADCELALTRYYYRNADALGGSLSQWEQRIAAQSVLADFPTRLVDDAAQWEADYRAQEALAKDAQRRADRAQNDLADAEKRLERTDVLGDQVSARPELQQQASAIAAASHDVGQANERVRKHGESADPATRMRFEQIEERLRPRREILPPLLDIYQRRSALAQKRVEQQSREAVLTKIAHGTVPLQLAGGLLLILLAIAAVAFGPRQIAPVLAYIAAIFALYFGFQLTRQGLLLRRVAEQSAGELRGVRDRIGELDAQTTELAALEAAVRDRSGCDAEAWAEVIADIPVYQALLPVLTEYALACRERDAAQQRIDNAWGTVRQLSPDAPADPSPQWLATRIRELDDRSGSQQRRADLFAEARDKQREADQAQTVLPQRREQLSRMLEPLGLAEHALSDPADSLRQVRALAGEAQEYQKARQGVAGAAERVRGQQMTAEEFERAWAALSDKRRQTLEASITDDASLAQVQERQRKLASERAAQLESRDKARAGAEQMRIAAAKHDDIPFQLQQAQEGEAAAEEQQGIVRRWERAMVLLRDVLRRLSHDLSSNLAPAINDQLDALLAQAPVAGVAQARISPDLNLNLRVDGAPAGLTGDALLGRLSTGARRQLALALRVAVSQAMGAARSVPLMLDEPLVELDDDRAADCLRYLGALAQGRQVLVTTCHRSQYAWLLSRAGVQANVVDLSPQRAAVAS